MNLPTTLEAAAYLAGMIDGEGSVVVGPRDIQGRRGSRWVQIVNTDPDLIEACEKACSLIGLSFKTTLRTRIEGRKPCWVIKVHRYESLCRLAAVVKLQSGRKAALLRQLVATYNRPPLPASCIHGHPFDLLNTYFRPGFPRHRSCRACHATTERRARRRGAEIRLRVVGENG